MSEKNLILIGQQFVNLLNSIAENKKTDSGIITISVNDLQLKAKITLLRIEEIGK